jgi:hypothetical protein
MNLSGLFGKAACAVGWHKWDDAHVEEGPKKSWAGLCSMWEYSAQAGKRPCARDGCETKQNVQRSAEPGGGDSPWRRASAKRIAEIEAMEDASKIHRCAFRRDELIKGDDHHGHHHH